jgi:hypothetical protein
MPAQALEPRKGTTSPKLDEAKLRRRFLGQFPRGGNDGFRVNFRIAPRTLD